MNFKVESASWTRGFDMAKGDEETNAHREIIFTLKRDNPYGGAWYRLASGGTLLGYDQMPWEIRLTVGEAIKDAPWKGVATVFPKGQHDSEETERLLHFSLKLAREELNDCWDAVMRGAIPETVDISLRENEPEIGWSKVEKFDREWNDIEHRHVEVLLASFRYAQQKPEPTSPPKEHPLAKSGMIIVGLLSAILAALIFKR